MHTRSAVAGALATVSVGAFAFVAVSTANAENGPAEQPAAVVEPGHYSTLESQDPIVYVPAPEPVVVEPVAVPEPAPVVVEEPAVTEPAPAPASEPAPGPAANEAPPSNLNLGTPPPRSGTAPGGSGG